MHNWFGTGRVRGVGVGLATLAMLVAGAARAYAETITFAPGQYDNTSNTVTGGPTTNNLQTTGTFRDVIWWSINNGAPRVGSPDYINSGNNLVLCGISACDNGTGAYTALNFTGPSISGGQSYMSLYDTTPADGSATGNLFNAAAPGGVTLTADVLFASNHASSGGIVAMYNGGQDALALMVGQMVPGGSSLDPASLSLVYQSTGQGVTLQNVNMTGNPVTAGNWYQLGLNIQVTGNTVNVTGTIYSHSTPTNPNSALGTLLQTLTYTTTLSDPDGGLAGQTLVLTNPGQVGLIAMGRESISSGCSPLQYQQDQCTDNVGVSITNFEVPTAVPEPGSMLLLGAGLLLIGRRVHRRT